jgi:hypothetical protein
VAARLPIQDYPLPILKTFVEQVGQTPWVAGFLFFMMIALGFFMSLLARHFTQYAFVMTPSRFDLNDSAASIRCQQPCQNMTLRRHASVGSKEKSATSEVTFHDKMTLD